MNDWYPGKKPSETEMLQAEIVRLTRKVLDLQNRLMDAQIYKDQYNRRQQILRSEQGTYG